MKTALIAMTTLLMSGAALAGHSVSYSNTHYCTLASQGAYGPYLHAYAAKLGYTPSHQECLQLRAQPQVDTAGQWQFRGNKPYPHSVKRLSAQTVTKLKTLSPAERAKALAAN